MRTTTVFGVQIALQDIREAAGLSQSELARRMNTQPSTISRIESGDRDPSLDQIWLWAEKCGRLVVLEFPLPPADEEARAQLGEAHYAMHVAGLGIGAWLMKVEADEEEGTWIAFEDQQQALADELNRYEAMVVEASNTIRAVRERVPGVVVSYAGPENEPAVMEAERIMLRLAKCIQQIAETESKIESLPEGDDREPLQDALCELSDVRWTLCYDFARSVQDIPFPKMKPRGRPAGASS
jgi:transcriptional regulator with XRE-family HTH domain